ncbi:hypothetical protein Pelo_17376 [Pelomyxa schiedti]|nr:hypothetical protein Pelo_17376 [Pelomyxa schiedti]
MNVCVPDVEVNSCTIQGTLSARAQVGALACASVPRCRAGTQCWAWATPCGGGGDSGGPRTVAWLVWSHVLATQLRVVVNLDGDRGTAHALFGVSPSLLGLVGRPKARAVASRVSGTQWLTGPRCMNLSCGGQADLPVELCDLEDSRGTGERMLSRLDPDGNVREPGYFGKGHCGNRRWAVQCGRNDDESLFMAIMPALDGEPGGVAAIPLPYVASDDRFFMVACNSAAEDELILVLSPQPHTTIFVLIDTIMTYSTRSLVVIISSLCNIEEEQWVENAFHIKGSNQQSGSGVFVAQVRPKNSDPSPEEMMLWQVWKVADSGKKQVLPTSSSTAEIRLSWLAGSKFIVCCSGADEGEPDYEVWDCQEDSTGPAKPLKAVRFPEPDNRVTVAESFCVITVLKSTIVVLDALSEFRVLTGRQLPRIFGPEQPSEVGQLPGIP